MVLSIVDAYMYGIQWNPSIMNSILNQHFVPNSEASGILPVGMVLCNLAVPVYTGREG